MQGSFLVSLAIYLSTLVAVEGEQRSVPATQMVAIKAGNFRPFYSPSAEEDAVAIEAFWLDVDPVTNRDFLLFVKSEPKWRRDRISPLFADDGYLLHWAEPLTLGPGAGAKQPVTRVSWFAAKAYCAWRAARLPIEMEWEYVAAANETQKDARHDARWREKILAWYARPSTKSLPEVGASSLNYWGVRDLHGLIWEWVSDFNSLLVTGDSRDTKPTDSQAFCGAGALGAKEAEDYASFMRIAFRSALGAQYTTKTLGFRCAKDTAS